MEEEGRQAETSLSKFSYALDQLEQNLRPVLQAIDELRASGNEDDLDPMSRARMHISLCYSINALFCMYLRTQGVDPATHPVSEEIGRVQEAFMRMRKVEAGLSVDHQRLPDRDRRRHIVNAKKSAQKLASLVFPEEVDLLNAMRGIKRKRKALEEEKEKKRKTEEKTLMFPVESELSSSDEDEDVKQGGDVTKSQRASQVHDGTDSSSEEEHNRGGHIASAKREREKAGSGEETVSGKKKKKKKKKSTSKSKDSSVDSEKKVSSDKKKKKDKKDRTPKEFRRSEEKRKRKKRHSKMEE